MFSDYPNQGYLFCYTVCTAFGMPAECMAVLCYNFCERFVPGITRRYSNSQRFSLCSDFQCPHYENTPIQIYRHFHLQKLKFFRYKNSEIFHMSAQNIDCGYPLEPPRRGGSNDYPQSMFLSRNKKIIYTPVNPSFTIWTWGLKGSTLYRHVFVMSLVLIHVLLHIV